jgi:hypothetical protein
MELASKLGIVGGGSAMAMANGFVHGLDAERAVAALRWEAANPWARVFEKLSTHPLVGRRIAALEASGLPGRPTWLGLDAATASRSDIDRGALRSGFAGDVAALAGPWMALAASVALLLAAPGSWLGGILMVSAGVLFTAAQMRRYPFTFAPVDGVTSLLERIDASPIRGIPVTVRGRVVGRATPGYLLEADLVVEDDSGMVALGYRSPVPFGAAIFGFRRAEGFIGRTVTARGWYRRTPNPVIELREMAADDGSRRARPWLWLARFAFAGVVLVCGLTVTLVQLVAVSSA